MLNSSQVFRNDSGLRVWPALARVAVGLLFLTSGILHFLRPEPFVAIMPPWLPSPQLLVYISGFFEILGAIALQIPALRAIVGWGLIALLLAVLPANIFMLTNHPYIGNLAVPMWILWLRLPLQFALICLVWWCSRPRPA